MRICSTFIVILLTALIIFGCSNTDETESEPGLIQTQTEAIGHEAAKMLKTPMDKASKAADKENLRSQQLEERLNNID